MSDNALRIYSSNNRVTASLRLHTANTANRAILLNMASNILKVANIPGVPVMVHLLKIEAIRHILHKDLPKVQMPHTTAMHLLRGNTDKLLAPAVRKVKRASAQHL